MKNAKPLVAYEVTGGCRDGDGVGRSWVLIEQTHFAHDCSVAEPGEVHQPVARQSSQYVDLPVLDKIQPVRGIALLEQCCSRVELERLRGKLNLRKGTGIQVRY